MIWSVRILECSSNLAVSILSDYFSVSDDEPWVGDNDPMDYCSLSTAVCHSIVLISS